MSDISAYRPHASLFSPRVFRRMAIAAARREANETEAALAGVDQDIAAAVSIAAMIWQLQKVAEE